MADVMKGYVRGAVLRLTNVYGPGPRIRGAGRGVLNAMVRRAVTGEPLTVYGSGNYLRDYLYVRDAALAFVAAAEAIEALNGGHWVIGSGEGNTINDAVNQIAEPPAAPPGPPLAVEPVQAPLPPP